MDERDLPEAEYRQYRQLEIRRTNLLKKEAFNYGDAVALSGLTKGMYELMEPYLEAQESVRVAAYKYLVFWFEECGLMDHYQFTQEDEASLLQAALSEPDWLKGQYESSEVAMGWLVRGALKDKFFFDVAILFSAWVNEKGMPLPVTVGKFCGAVLQGKCKRPTTPGQPRMADFTRNNHISCDILHMSKRGLQPTASPKSGVSGCHAVAETWCMGIKNVERIWANGKKRAQELRAKFGGSV